MPDQKPPVEPADEHFESLLERRAAPIASLARDLRALVRSTLPDVTWMPNRGTEGIAFGANQYGHDGWGIGVVGIARNWVTLGLMRGAHLPDPRGIVEGTGRNVRHVKIRSARELEERRDALVTLIRAATGSPAPIAVQGALDLHVDQVPDEPVRHSALAAERSQALHVVAGASSAVGEAPAAAADAPRSVVGKVGASRGSTKKPAAKKPAAKKPAAKKPAAKKPAAKKPAAKKPAAKKPAAKKPAAKKPAARKPAARKPAAKKPAAKKPAAKKPAAKKPAARKPAARKPAAKKPAAKKPGAKKPAARKPAARKR